MSGQFGGAVLIYVAGQAFNFLFQVLLLRLLGGEQYGPVGLAHLLLVTVIFLADLGYASLFLRDPPSSPGWAERWREAFGHRLLATLLLDLAIVAGWGLFDDLSGAGGLYLLGVLPATWLGLINYSAPLLAEGRRLQGLALAQIAWPASCLLWLLTTHLPLAPALEAALAVSGGFLLQATVQLAVMRQPRLLLPIWTLRSELLRAAMHMSATTVVGTLHDRLTPFLLAPLAPSFLPSYLLLGHLLAGLSGVCSQASRLLITLPPEGAGATWTMRLASLVLLATLAGVLLGGGLLAAWPVLPYEHWPLMIPALLSWCFSSSGGFLAALMIAARRERLLAQVVISGLLASAAAQLAGYALESPDLLLWSRVFGTAAILAYSLRLMGMTTNRAGWLALLSAALVPLAPPYGWYGLAALLPLVLALPDLYRQRGSLFVRRPAAGSLETAGGT